MKNYILQIVLSIACIHASVEVGCAQSSTNKTTEKPKYLWFDAEANFKRFCHKDSITFYLDKAKATGFNQIVVDVRPIQGDVLYRSSFMTPMTELGNTVYRRDWDYLQFFIDEAKKRELKVTVSTVIFPGGRPGNRQGMVYRSNEWNGKTAMEYTADGKFLDIRNDPSKVASFMNPVLPEVQNFCLSFIREIVTNYNFDGYVLDYCRYSGPDADFSQTTRDAFEKYTGKKVENFPQDVDFRQNGKDVPLWMEFRAKVIHDFIQRARNEIKAIKPNVKLEYWTGSWYPELYKQGQNWASKKYDPSKEHEWASPGYKNTGFADLLDIFMCGTYLEVVYGKDNPVSIEAGLAKAKELIMGENTMVGSIYALNYKDIEDATYVSLSQSAGVVVFDIVQVIEYDLWDELKRGIDRAEKEIK